MSDLGGTHIRTGTVSPPTPATNLETLRKGRRISGDTPVPIVLAALPEENTPIAGPIPVDREALRRSKVIVVGTKLRNARPVKLFHALVL